MEKQKHRTVTGTVVPLKPLQEPAAGQVRAPGALWQMADSH